jgi:hypothetical protein
MEGKRFGVGLAAGILLGLAIIAGSGAISSPVGVFGSLSNSLNSAPATTFTAAMTTTTETQTQTSSSSTSPAFAGGAVPPPTTGNKTAATTTTASTSQNLPATQAGSSATPRLAFSSRVSSITSQPLLSNAVLIVPILLAFLFGAVLYRASIRGREPSGQESP